MHLSNARRSDSSDPQLSLILSSPSILISSFSHFTILSFSIALSAGYDIERVSAIYSISLIWNFPFTHEYPIAHPDYYELQSFTIASSPSSRTRPQDFNCGGTGLVLIKFLEAHSSFDIPLQHYPSPDIIRNS